MKTTSLLALTIASCCPLLALAQDPGGAAAQEPIALSSAEVQVRTEYFALRAPGATPEADPVALVAWRLCRTPGGPVLEREVLFGEGELRLLHTENLGLAEPRLVWRELGPQGRTWLAEWSPTLGRLRALEFGPAKEVHGELTAPRVSFPLALVEELRAGQVRAGDLQLLSPTRAGLERASLEACGERPGDLPLALERELASRPVGDLRWVELRSARGELLGAYLLEGRELLAFRWSDGGAWAERVEAQTWAELAEGWRAAAGRRAEGAPAGAQAPRSEPGKEAAARPGSDT